MEGQPTGFEIAFVYTIYKVNSQGGSKHMTTVVRLSKTFLQNDIEVCNGTVVFFFRNFVSIGIYGLWHSLRYFLRYFKMD